MTLIFSSMYSSDKALMFEVTTFFSLKSKYSLHSVMLALLNTWRNWSQILYSRNHSYQFSIKWKYYLFCRFVLIITNNLKSHSGDWLSVHQIQLILKHLGDHTSSEQFCVIYWWFRPRHWWFSKAHRWF